MPKPEQQSDGTWALSLPDGREITGEDPQALERYAQEVRQAKDARGIFLDTWKVAVRLAGPQFFSITAESIDTANDKQQLRPDVEAIKQDAGVLSGGERRFLFALVSFFNHEIADELWGAYGETGNPGELAQQLDRHRAQIITDLMLSYGGW